MKNKKRFMRLPLLLMGVFLVLASSCDSRKGSFTDPRDGNVYKTVTIGEHVWMAENLAYAPSSGNYWAYDNDDANVEVYGYLYDWQTALNVCPTGWHLPNDGEWAQLYNYLEDDAGGKLKTTGTIEARTGLWYAPNTGATNETGFTALPGGQRKDDGSFNLIGSNGTWWSATEDNFNFGGTRYLGYSHSVFWSGPGWKRNGFSVRCLRNID